MKKKIQQLIKLMWILWMVAASAFVYSQNDPDLSLVVSGKVKDKNAVEKLRKQSAH